MDFSTTKKIFVGILTVGLFSFPQPSKAQYYGDATCSRARTVPVWKEPVVGPNGNWIPGRYEMETFIDYYECPGRYNNGYYGNPRIYTPGPSYGYPSCTSFGWRNGGGSKYWFNLGC